MQYHIKDFSRYTSSSSSRPRTAAFHAVNGGSNPPEDAKNFQGLRENSKSFLFFVPLRKSEKIFCISISKLKI